MAFSIKDAIDRYIQAFEGVSESMPNNSYFYPSMHGVPSRISREVPPPPRPAEGALAALNSRMKSEVGEYTPGDAPDIPDGDGGNSGVTDAASAYNDLATRILSTLEAHTDRVDPAQVDDVYIENIQGGLDGAAKHALSAAIISMAFNGGRFDPHMMSVYSAIRGTQDKVAAATKTLRNPDASTQSKREAAQAIADAGRAQSEAQYRQTALNTLGYAAQGVAAIKAGEQGLAFNMAQLHSMPQTDPVLDDPKYLESLTSYREATKDKDVKKMIDEQAKAWLAYQESKRAVGQDEEQRSSNNNNRKRESMFQR